MIYILHSENLYTFQNVNITLNSLKTIAKTFEKVLRLHVPMPSTIQTRNVSFTFEVILQNSY